MDLAGLRPVTIERGAGPSHCVEDEQGRVVRCGYDSYAKAKEAASEGLSGGFGEVGKGGLVVLGVLGFAGIAILVGVNIKKARDKAASEKAKDLVEQSLIAK